MHTKFRKRIVIQHATPIAAHYMPHSKAENLILHQRANQIAKYQTQKIDVSQMIQYICFKLGHKEFYGVSYYSTKEVMYHVPVAKLPDVPNFIAGVINRRGIFISVLDLKKLFNIKINTFPDEKENSAIIIVTGNNMTVGLLVDSIVGSDTYDLATLDIPIPSQGMIKSEYILGLHQGRTTIINMEAVLSDTVLQVKKG